MAKPPALPMTIESVLPGEGWVPGSYRLREPVPVFDTWKPQRRLLQTLAAGTPVTLVSGVCQVIKPDIITVTSPMPELGLSEGDTLLRYREYGEGNADFWAKGRWYANADLGWVRNADGSGCQQGCKAQESAPGRKIWWFQVRGPNIRSGWSNAMDGLNPNRLTPVRVPCRRTPSEKENRKPSCHSNPLSSQLSLNFGGSFVKIDSGGLFTTKLTQPKGIYNLQDLPDG